MTGVIKAPQIVDMPQHLSISFEFLVLNIFSTWLLDNNHRIKLSDGIGECKIQRRPSKCDEEDADKEEKENTTA